MGSGQRDGLFWKKLCAMHSDLEVIREKLTTVSSQKNDHERRIRFLEKYAWLWIGICTLAGLLIGALV